MAFTRTNFLLSAREKRTVVANLPPDQGSPEHKHAGKYLSLIIGLPLLTFMGNILILSLSPYSLSPDEAHYFEWSSSLDWSYYSKGPLIALMIRFFRNFTSSPFWSVKLVAISCHFLFISTLSYSLYRHYSSKIAATTLSLTVGMLIFIQTGVLATTDPPCALLWLVAVLCLRNALFARSAAAKTNRKRLNPWILAGIATGLGIWAKYTTVSLVVGLVAYCLITPHGRRLLFTKPFIIFCSTAGLFLLPIIYWNYQNGWVNFAHNSHHISKGSSLRPEKFFELIGAQIGLVGPIQLFLLLLAVASLVRILLKQRSDRNLPGLFYILTSLPLLLICLAVSLKKSVYANWPMPIYIGGLLALTEAMKHDLMSTKKLLKYAHAYAGMAVVIAYSAFLGATFYLPGKILPTKKLVGWIEVAEWVEHHRENYGHEAKLITDTYGVASELHAHLPGHPSVLCANLGDRRMNQHDIWMKAKRQEIEKQLKNEEALVILKSPQSIEKMKVFFEKMELIDHHVVKLSGDSIRNFSLYRVQKYHGRLFEPPTGR